MAEPLDPTGIIATVAHNIREARQRLGLSQEELADRADVDRTYVSQIERRQKNITISVLARVAVALRVPPDRLLLKAEPAPSPRRRSAPSRNRSSA